MTLPADALALDRRTKTDRRKSEPSKVTVRKSTKPSSESKETPTADRRTARRRQIDPTTCERDYSADELEFMQAVDEYKRQSGRMFPTCSEILEVVRGLGYIKMSGGQPT